MKFQEFMDKSHLIRVHQDFQNYFVPLRKDLKKWDLNINESLILLSLFFEKNDVAYPWQLQNTLSLPKDQISHALKGLHQQKLIHIGLSVEDRRKRTLTLTKKGRKLTPKLVALFDFWENHLEKQPPN